MKRSFHISAPYQLESVGGGSALKSERPRLLFWELA
ncbi:MAG: hypothetical protein JWQ75_4034, partial [Pseudarthrobacter sp.]|nr:hypothetical protein [Pseudarthrobacter sp.]